MYDKLLNRHEYCTMNKHAISVMPNNASQTETWQSELKIVLTTTTHSDHRGETEHHYCRDVTALGKYDCKFSRQQIHILSLKIHKANQVKEACIKAMHLGTKNPKE